MARKPVSLPTEPGVYYWSEYHANVTLYKKRGGRYLYVVPPLINSPEVRITPRIAGQFILVERNNNGQS